MSAETEAAAKERAENQRRISEKLKAKQMVVPVQPDKTAVQQSDEAKCRQLLEERGWVFAGTDDRGAPLFSDPQGAGDRSGKYVVAKELPNRDGEPTVIKQMVVPPSGWAYRLGEAYACQLARDELAKKQQPMA